MAVILYLVAVTVVLHKRIHICVIMVHVDRSRVFVICRIMIPVPRRFPGTVVVPADMVENDWPCVIYRADDVVRPVDV